MYLQVEFVGRRLYLCLSARCESKLLRAGYGGVLADYFLESFQIGQQQGRGISLGVHHVAYGHGDLRCESKLLRAGYGGVLADYFLESFQIGQQQGRGISLGVHHVAYGHGDLFFQGNGYNARVHFF